MIVVVRVGGEGSTIVSERTCASNFKERRHPVRRVHCGRAAFGTSQARRASHRQAQLHDDEAVESEHNLATVLGDGSRESGGHHVRSYRRRSFRQWNGG